MLPVVPVEATQIALEIMCYMCTVVAALLSYVMSFRF